MSSHLRPVRNDWSDIRAPELGQWRPTLPTSVVIPAYNCQASLALTLAALARQTYPAELLQVVVVDDNSDPPLELPSIRPTHCRLIRAGDHSDGWGRANALHVGAHHSDGTILHWLDADIVVYPRHVEAQARWHHQVPYAVTLGWKRFLDVRPDGPDAPSPEEVADACAADAADGLFAGHNTTPHHYVERYIERTDQLRAGDHLAFMIHVGATAALRRELYDAAGGLNATLRLGEDTELGYRLAQAGALFVPEPRARSWHLGPSHMMQHEAALRRYNHPFLADLVPQPRWLRKAGGSGWLVPLVTVVVDVGDGSLERVRAVVDAILLSDETDLQVVLVGPWSSLGDQRMSPLQDPQLDLRLIAASYRSDPRVRLVEQAPRTAFPSPYLLEVSAHHGLGRPAISRLLDIANRYQVGLVQTTPSGSGTGGQVRLWRTAALGRAHWVRQTGESIAAAVAAVHGARDADPRTIGVVDLSGRTAADLAPGASAVWAAVDHPGRWLPTTVEVAGVRSLARATLVVGRRAAARVSAQARRLARSR